MSRLNAVIMAIFALLTANSAEADLIANFEFAGGSLTPTLDAFATSNGITVSDLSAPYTLTDGDADLEGVKTADNIAIQGVDTPSGGSGSQLTAGQFVSFSLTIPSTVTVDLDFISAEVAGVDVFIGGNGGHTSRIFSSIHGFDDISGDTIGRFGYQSSGDSPFAVQGFGLSDTSGNSPLGGNVVGADFQNLSDVTVEFVLPFIDNSSSISRGIIIDNLSIEGSLSAAIPEPNACFVLMIGGSALGLRRRR